MNIGPYINEDNLPKSKIKGSEYDEYLYQDELKNTGAYPDQESFDKAVDKAEIVYISDFSEIENTDADKQKKGDYKFLIDTLWEYKKTAYKSKDEYEKYLSGLIEDSKADEAGFSLLADMDNGIRLVGGNTRAMIHRFLGKPVPVKIIPMKTSK